MSSFIDEALLGGILGGVVVALCAAWLLYVRNHLWRELLRRNGWDEAVRELGLEEGRERFGPHLLARGAVDGCEVRLVGTAATGVPRLRVTWVDPRSGVRRQARRPLEQTGSVTSWVREAVRGDGV